ncbi:MAG: hypothetical protein COU08_04555 [Candidatus Harrisonbacteria bacterium CG10_big_fil_rev_8_21_14_0_10_42_17]|uniref:Uncharacterized protein n=1 Tax=Candidatus Harrisonbacteria bacterium CG10_big_fil_rev_8_21_14_0_10_42_17 TaxID=1974584 RepID=A0A2M6WH94_9BACT|nr:MAG: hypothetical protein COU08_04555 [Candidatus Harrisonbacteria bacterium CG10_big_fil_rev_8_21_14_0_10_42_17]
MTSSSEQGIGKARWSYFTEMGKGRWSKIARWTGAYFAGASLTSIAKAYSREHRRVSIDNVAENVRQFTEMLDCYDPTKRLHVWLARTRDVQTLRRIVGVLRSEEMVFDDLIYVDPHGLKFRKDIGAKTVAIILSFR